MQYVKLKRESSIIGKVVQVNPFFACCNFSPKYNLHNHRGKTVAEIVWKRGRLKSCMFTDDFQVYSTLSKRRDEALVGSISRQTKAICLEDYSCSDADTYALSFHDIQVDRTLKALLVAAVIMLVTNFYYCLMQINLCCKYFLMTSYMFLVKFFLVSL